MSGRSFYYLSDDYDGTVNQNGSEGEGNMLILTDEPEPVHRPFENYRQMLECYAILESQPLSYKVCAGTKILVKLSPRSRNVPACVPGSKYSDHTSIAFSKDPFRHHSQIYTCTITSGVLFSVTVILIVEPDQ